MLYHIPCLKKQRTYISTYQLDLHTLRVYFKDLFLDMSIELGYFVLTLKILPKRSKISGFTSVIEATPQPPCILSSKKLYRDVMNIPLRLLPPIGASGAPLAI